MLRGLALVHVSEISRRICPTTISQRYAITRIQSELDTHITLQSMKHLAAALTPLRDDSPLSLRSVYLQALTGMESTKTNEMCTSAVRVKVQVQEGQNHKRRTKAGEIARSTVISKKMPLAEKCSHHFATPFQRSGTPFQHFGFSQPEQCLMSEVVGIN